MDEGRNSLKPTAANLAQIRALLSESEGLTKTTPRRRLLIIEGIIQGKTDAEISKELGQFPQRINKVRQELKQNGLSYELDALERRIRASAQKLIEKPSKHRGRPGTTTTEEWVSAIDIGSEPVAEIASLVITKGAVVVVLATKLFTKNEVFDGELDDPAWTEISEFDSLAKDTFDTLDAVSVMLEQRQNPPEHGKGELRIRESFGPGYDFHMLSTGDSVQEEKCLRMLPLGISVKAFKKIDSPSTLIRYVEKLLYRLRETRGCIGLLPALWDLYNEENIWLSEKECADFTYAADLGRIENWLKHRAVTRNYFSTQGALFEMHRKLWGSIPYKKAIQCQSLKLRQKIAALNYDEATKRLIIQVEPLPEIALFIEVDCEEKPAGYVEGLRKILRLCKTNQQFFYNPFDCTPGTGKTTGGLTGFLETGEVRYEPVSMTLVQRHFLTPKPELTIVDVAQKSESTLSGFTKCEVAVAGSNGSVNSATYYFLNMPGLLALITDCYVGNRYGDRLRSLREWQDKLRVANFQKPRSSFEYLGSLFRLSPSSGTHYSFHNVGDLSDSFIEENGRRLGDIADAKETMDKAIEREYADRAESWPASLRGDDLHIAGIRDRLQERCFPLESFEVGFQRLLINLDADFLLSQMDVPALLKLSEYSKQWNDPVRQLIAETYWDRESGDINWGHVTGCVPDSLREALHSKRHRVEVPSYVSEALGEFLKSQERYVVRCGIENAQRMILSGISPRTCAMESEGRIIRRWRSFLGTFLAGRLHDNFRKAKRRFRYDDTKPTGPAIKSPDNTDDEENLNVEHDPFADTGD